MEINNLSKEELVKLKSEIDSKLNKIEVKTTKPVKGTILSLKKDDKIFGIRLSFGPHRLEEPNELNGLVDIIDYCEVTDNDLRGKSYDFRINISHPNKPFGIGITLTKDDYKNEHCLLGIDTNKTGYDSFFTLKPETWKEDLIRLLNENIENRKKYFQKDLDLLESKLDLFIQSQDKINEYI
jgi:hypothetical protein